MKTKSSLAGAMFMKRRTPEHELCHFYDGFEPWKNPHCSRARRRSKV